MMYQISEVVPVIGLREFSEDEVLNLRDRTYSVLRNLILEGGLRAGERIVEREVAAVLGVSTTPIKEALRRLETDGLVKTRPRRGTFTTMLTKTELAEMGVIRGALESVVARLAATKITPREAARLSVTLDAMRKATSDSDTERLNEANAHFHEQLRQIADSSYLAKLVEVLRFFERISRTELMRHAEERQRAIAEHEAIYAAVVDRDAALAERLMRAHVERSLAVLRTADEHAQGDHDE